MDLPTSLNQVKEHVRLAAKLPLEDWQSMSQSVLPSRSRVRHMGAFFVVVVGVFSSGYFFRGFEGKPKRKPIL